MIVLFIGLFCAFLFLGMPIAFCLVASSLGFVLGDGLSVRIIVEKFLSGPDSFTLLAVPFFILAANIMNTGGVTERIFDFANKMVGHIRGGLGHVNIFASVIFAGMSGAAVADAGGLGQIELKAMRKAGFDDDFSLAVTGASSTIGPVIPPSIPAVVFSVTAGVSVGRLFIAGIVPGLLMALALAVVVYVTAKKRNYPAGVSLPAKEFIALTFRSLPALFSVVVLLGGIYSGVVTPTEAGALAAAYALLVSVFFYRAFSFKDLKQVLLNTVKSVGTLSLLVGCAYAFSYIVTIEKIPATVANLLLGITDNKYVMLLVINVMFLALGMFIDTMAITLVFIPIVLPLINALGIDLVHFGVVIVINMMVGLTTPPFGMLLFITSGISKTPLKSIIREIVPMIYITIGVLFLLTYVPQLVTFIPRMAGF